MAGSLVSDEEICTVIIAKYSYCLKMAADDVLLPYRYAE